MSLGSAETETQESSRTISGMIKSYPVVRNSAAHGHAEWWLRRKARACSILCAFHLAPKAPQFEPSIDCWDPIEIHWMGHLPGHPFNCGPACKYASKGAAWVEPVGGTCSWTVEFSWVFQYWWSWIFLAHVFLAFAQQAVQPVFMQHVAGWGGILSKSSNEAPRIPRFFHDWPCVAVTLPVARKGVQRWSQLRNLAEAIRSSWGRNSPSPPQTFSNQGPLPPLQVEEACVKRQQRTPNTQPWPVRALRVEGTLWTFAES